MSSKRLNNFNLYVIILFPEIHNYICLSMHLMRCSTSHVLLHSRNGYQLDTLHDKVWIDRAHFHQSGNYDGGDILKEQNGPAIPF